MLKRLLAMMLILIITSIGGFNFWITSRVNDMIMEESDSIRDTTIERGVLSVGGCFQKMQSIILEGCVDEDIQEILTEYQNDPSSREDAGKARTLRNRQRMLSQNEMLIRSEIYPLIDGDYYCYDPASMRYDNRLDQQNLPFETADRSYNWRIQTGESGTSLTSAYTIYSTEDWKTPLGVIVTEMNANKLVEILRSMAIESTDSVCLINKEGNVVLSYGLPEKIPDELMEQNLPMAWNDSRRLHHYFLEVIPECGWSIAGAQGQSNMLKNWKVVEQIAFLSSVCAIVGISLLMYLIISEMIRPITALGEYMRDADAYDSTFGAIEIPNNATCEVQDLYESFNTLLAKQKDLIQQIYVARIEEQKAQMQALMAQINPHFLYNTLDSINWMAIKYRASDIQTMVSALATMLRHSLNRGNDTILIRNELEQVKSYLTIQQIRFKDWFTVSYDVDEELLDAEMIKLIMQPLVENAIVHGFERGQMGKMIISIHSVGENIQIQIKNNGTKIDLNKVRSAMRGETPQGVTSGYGLKNVNARLTKHYGENYGIRFKSEDEWTIAIIDIPSEEREK